jgi:hypothetical protein
MASGVFRAGLLRCCRSRDHRTADELAQETKTHAPSLHRLLQFLTNLGIFAEGADGKYRQTMLSETLRSDAPRTLRAFVIMLGSEFIWKPWGDLLQTIVTGQPAVNRVLGATTFDYLAAHPDDAAIVNAAMTSASSMQLSDILAAYDFSRFERIVDVGGGQGLLLYGILSACPRVCGILADQPSVVAGATALRTGALADRCEVVGIDFFQSVPEEADADIAKSVIHDWNDHDAVRILKKLSARDSAQRHDAFNRIHPETIQPARFRKVCGLANACGGPWRTERTEAEYGALLAEAGFSLTRVIPTAGTMSIIESQPV